MPILRESLAPVQMSQQKDSRVKKKSRPKAFRWQQKHPCFAFVPRMFCFCLVSVAPGSLEG